MKFLLDENFDNDVLRGVLREYPELDFIRAQDVPEIYGKDDPTVLSWAASQERILLTHDIRTMPTFAFERIQNSLVMPGVIGVSTTARIGEVIEDILTAVIAGCSEDFENEVKYIPFKSI